MYFWLLCLDMLFLRNKAFLVKLFCKNEESASWALHSYFTILGTKTKKRADDSDSTEVCLWIYLLEDHKRSGMLKNSFDFLQVAEQGEDRQYTPSAHGECSTLAFTRQSGIPYRSVWRSLRILLRRYPFKINWLCNYILVQMRNDSIGFYVFFWTDEVRLH